MNWRIAAAFILAPLVVPIPWYLYARFTIAPQAMARVEITYSIMFVVAYGVAVLLGMPLHKYLETRALRLLRHYLLAGSLLGVMPALILAFTSVPSEIPAGFLGVLLMAAAVGAVSAAAFWFIGLCSFGRSPNKTMEPTR